MSLFAASLCLACSSTTSLFLNDLFTFLALPRPPFVWYISVIAVFLFFLMLLVNLVLRLHQTFQFSLYEMSTRTIWIFAAIFMAEILCIIAYVVGSVWFNDYNHFALYGFGVLYLQGSILSALYFAGNLSKLAKQRVSTPRALEAVPSLDEHQHELLDLSAKLTLLFFGTILSSIFYFAAFRVVSEELAGLFFSIDLCTNVWLLYLQFSFAKKHYRRCCKCLDRMCKAAIAAQTKKALYSQLEAGKSIDSGAIAISTACSATE